MVDDAIIQVSDVLQAGAPSAGLLLVPEPFSPLAFSAIDLNFSLGAYWNGSNFSSDPTAFLSISRASIGTDLVPTSPQGASFTTFGNNVLRITRGNGILIEEARTNNLLNSDAPVTQTTASLGTGVYTLWVNGSGSATPSNGSGTIAGGAAATQGVPNTFTVTGAGTVVITVAGSLNNFQLELGAFGTSYIPTTGATATRAADSITSSGAGNAGLVDTTWRSAAGSVVMYFNIEGAVPTGASPRFLQDASDFAELSINDITSKNVYIIRDGGTNAAQTANVATVGAASKCGASWTGSGGSMSVVMNGGTVAGHAEGTDGAFTSPTSFGNRTSDLLRSINGYVARLVLWNSKIADVTLQGYTA